MAFGTELVWLWTLKINTLAPKRVQKIDGGDSWGSLAMSGGINLLLSWGSVNCGAAVITDNEKKSLLTLSKQTPSITNTLKSHLAGSEFVGCEQIRRDRIMKFTFVKTIGAGFSNTRYVILEAMERYSNILITDGDGIIIETAKHIHPADNPYRSVLPGQMYILPPEFSGITLEEWTASPSAETLPKIAGFGRALIKKTESLSLDDAVKYLSRFYTEEPSERFIFQKIGRYITAFPIELDSSEALSGDAAAEVVLAPMFKHAFDSRVKKITDHIIKEATRRERQIEDINKLLYNEEPEKYRIYGEAVVANLWKIKQGASEAELTSWDKEGREIICKVPLNPAMTASQNGARFFAKYKKIIAAQNRAMTVLQRAQEELDDLMEALALAMSVSDAESVAMLEEEAGIRKERASKGSKKKEAPLPPHKRFDLGYALVFAGLSAKGNRYVTFKTASPNDIWFHAQGIPGAHVILRFIMDTEEEERAFALNFCASLAADFSKGHGSRSLRVDYTQRKHVSPIKGGVANVTYKEFKSLTGDSDFWKEHLREIK